MHRASTILYASSIAVVFILGCTETQTIKKDAISIYNERNTEIPIIYNNGLPDNIVYNRIQEYEHGLNYAYGKELAEDPNVNGSAVVVFTIMQDGHVTSVSLDNSSIS